MRAMPPRFHLGRETSFCPASKDSICSGEGGCPRCFHPQEAKGEIDGRVHLGTGVRFSGRGQWLHCPGAMFFVHYLSLSLFIQKENSGAGRKEQDTGVRGPLGPPGCSAGRPGVGRPEGGCCTAWGCRRARRSRQESRVWCCYLWCKLPTPGPRSAPVPSLSAPPKPFTFSTPCPRP